MIPCSRTSIGYSAKASTINAGSSRSSSTISAARCSSRARLRASISARIARWSASRGTCPTIPVRAQLWDARSRQIGAQVEGDLGILAHRYQVGPAAIERAVASVQLLHPAGTPSAAGPHRRPAPQHRRAPRRARATCRGYSVLGRSRHRRGHPRLDLGPRSAACVIPSRCSKPGAFARKIARGTGVASTVLGPTGHRQDHGRRSHRARARARALPGRPLARSSRSGSARPRRTSAACSTPPKRATACCCSTRPTRCSAKRTNDVKGANDRYANLEVNYLLQRVEAFGGITILTTNLETAIDTALKRRLAAHIVFAAPEDDERAQLWERQTTTGDAPLARRCRSRRALARCSRR